MYYSFNISISNKYIHVCQMIILTGSCATLCETLLKPYYSYLADNLELTELLHWLAVNDVLTSYDYLSIKACVSPYKQNCCLLDLMMMKSDQQTQTFIQGLIECNQTHLAQQLDPEGNI